MSPNERDAIHNMPLSPSQTVFPTVVYRRYSAHWHHPMRNVAADTSNQDLIPGPLLRARAGDRLLVHFKNMDTLYKRPHSMHFHGVHYPFGSDGSFIPGFSGAGGEVMPGKTFTYQLRAGADSAGVWPYHDHSPSMMPSIAGGMYGALSILPVGVPRARREFVTFFESQLGFETINGRAFVGNTPVLHSRVGDTVQWDVLALGDETHVFHVHGHRWRDPDGTSIDSKTISPSEAFSFRIKEDRPGTWLYHCHIEQHMMRGMIGIYRVRR
jgi:FtsP/CotA-like multicopper oxidase with cupredoxin domain